MTNFVTNIIYQTNWVTNVVEQVNMITPVEIVQSGWDLFFIITQILVALITLAVPIFLYNFVKKDQAGRDKENEVNQIRRDEESRKYQERRDKENEVNQIRRDEESRKYQERRDKENEVNQIKRDEENAREKSKKKEQKINKKIKEYKCSLKKFIEVSKKKVFSDGKQICADWREKINMKNIKLNLIKALNSDEIEEIYNLLKHLNIIEYDSGSYRFTNMPNYNDSLKPKSYEPFFEYLNSLVDKIDNNEYDDEIKKYIIKENLI